MNDMLEYLRPPGFGLIGHPGRGRVFGSSGRFPIACQDEETHDEAAACCHCPAKKPGVLRLHTGFPWLPGAIATESTGDSDA